MYICRNIYFLFWLRVRIEVEDKNINRTFLDFFFFFFQIQVLVFEELPVDQNIKRNMNHIHFKVEM